MKKMKINDAEITARLEKIRQSVGGRIRDDHVPLKADYRTTEAVLGRQSLEKSVHAPTGLFVRNGRPGFVYIKDHTGYPNYKSGGIRFGSLLGDFENRDPIERDSDPRNPQNLRKLHFTFCSTLRSQEKKERLKSRYHFTDRTDDLYPVNLGMGDEELRLYPCQNCLAKINYDGFRFNLPVERKKKIVRSFKAKIAKENLQRIFQSHIHIQREFEEKTASARSEYAPVGYSSQNNVFSKQTRERANHVCEMCGFEGDEKSTDMHHKDGNKRNNSPENRQCLCKDCHAKIHPHYRPRR